jgi:hypothetical protein
VLKHFQDKFVLQESRDSSVGIGLGYGLDDRGSIPSWGNDGIFSLHHHVETDSGAHSVSHPIGTGDSFPGSKAVGARS